MTFEEHLVNHRSADGSYDLDAAEQDRAAELAGSQTDILRLAAKAAKQERAAWSRDNTDRLRKQFMQDALCSELEMTVMVPLGDSVAVEYGQMNGARIQLRKDLRTKIHLDENRAFDTEMRHWLETQALLEPGETVAVAQSRLQPSDVTWGSSVPHVPADGAADGHR